MDGKVIQAFPKRELPDCPVEVERSRGYCRHPTITVVEHDRLVVCTKCNATLDPFEYLRGEVLSIRHGWDAYRQVSAACTEKRAQIEALEKERRRLAAQVKRLQAKTADTTIDVRKPL